MGTPLRLILLTSLIPAATVGAWADEAACTKFKWPIAAERQMLTAPGIVTVASGDTVATPGQGMAVTLRPEADVTYAVKPARPPKASPSHGAELVLGGVTKPGTVQVTLSDEAWVDLVQNGKAIRSAGFSGQAGCPGVRKSVRFSVAAGPVTIEISDAAASSLKLAVTTVP